MLQVLLCVLIFQNIATGDESKIDPKLAAVLKKNEKVNVVISFKDGIKSTLSRAAAVRHGDRGTHNTHIINELEKNADSSQTGVVRMLNARIGESAKGFKYFKQYKTTNSIFVREATPEFVQLLSNDSQVSKISAEPIAKWVFENANNAIKADDSRPEIDSKDLKPENMWHIDRIQAREAWEVLGGRSGDGVVVGMIDTGVNGYHESLIGSFRGVNDYGWFDPVEGRSEPYDYNRGGAGNLKYEYLRDCFEWLSCPTLPDGSARNCSKDHVLVWRELGIIPIFASGNQGPRCRTSTSPGEYPFVISVGITSEKIDQHNWRTALGPSFFGPIKPDISAPGQFIWVAQGRFNDSYVPAEGSSMASPVVTGVVALLKVRDPDMTYDEVYDLLTQNTDDVLTVTLRNFTHYCKNQSWDVRPNNYFGYGRVNALKAVNAQTELLKLKGKL